MNWTDEQLDVIRLRNRNILVSAAAGSGKTAVLVERIIKRIMDVENPMDIDKLLVVTFTKAAAAEMRERIANAIDAQMVKNPQDENLRKQQTLLNNAQITTIDSFCLFVVRNHFEEIDLDPNFRIADSGEIKLLEMDVLDAVFEENYQKGEKGFLHLVDAYSNKRSNKAIKDMVLKIYHQSASNPWPMAWIASLAYPYQIKDEEELLSTDWFQNMFSYVKALVCEMPNRLEHLKEIALKPDGPNKYAITLEKDLKLFEGIEAAEDYNTFAAKIKSIDGGFSRMESLLKYEGDPQKKEAVKEGRDAIKKEIGAFCKQYFSLSLEEMVEQFQRMRPIAEELVRLSLEYATAMEEKKKEKHIMDFSDVEHAALRIFVDENTKEVRPTAFDFQKQFDEIMIDEYQDSNQVQEEILCAISRESIGEHNRFMVGDVKQSIYRFRLARPELFMEKFNTYATTDSKTQRIDLHKNFRSRQEVLQFTNDVFYKIMSTDLGNVAYDEKAALYCGADYVQSPGMEAEVLLFEKDSWDNGDEMSTRQLEARMIAERIVELKKTLQIEDKATKTLRPVRNSDIVILLRSLQGWGEDFVRVLSDFDIPAHVTTSTGYFSAVEVQLVLSFLKILDNPYQDIPMAAVLKSAIVGLDNEELAEISLREDASSFAEAALQAMEEAKEGKLYAFNQLYRSLRKKVSDTPIHQLLNIVMEETGYLDYVKALPAGAQRKANLDMLIEKAIAYEKTSYKGLFHFVRYIDQLQKFDVDFGEADVIGENEDVVRIMTIHKSKGLEFPVVFVSGISKEFNDRDTKEKIAIHPDMGLGLDEITVSPRTKRSCLIRSEIAERIRRDNLGEELRVLYVALTRAKEKLILTGTVKNKEEVYKNYTGMVIEKKPLSFGQRSSARKYLDWVAPALLSYPDRYAFTFKNAENMVLTESFHAVQMEQERQTVISRIENAKENLVDVFRQKFAYQYPFEQEKNKKTKYSVSEIKHASMVENYDRMEGEVEVPEFLLEETESYIPEFARKMDANEVVEETIVENRGALRGTAVHRVMECLDFTKLLEVDVNSSEALSDFLETELDRMIKSKLLPIEQYELIRKAKVLTFLRSDVAKRMATASANGNLYKEKPFVMDFDGALIQGIIDVFWIEGGKVVLLDYKTDRVQTKEELVARYREQLVLYADALKRIFSTNTAPIDTTENLIYSFGLEETIEVE